MARRGDNLIHARGWLTYPCGVHTKWLWKAAFASIMHATDFDRSLVAEVNPLFIRWEECIMDHYRLYRVCVSTGLTRRTVDQQYHQDCTVFAMHNAVYVHCRRNCLDIPAFKSLKEKVVTFLGRITPR